MREKFSSLSEFVREIKVGLTRYYNKRPEQYRWNSLGYHVQTNNQDSFLSADFGPGEIRSAVTSELRASSTIAPMHVPGPRTIAPTYGAGRAGLKEFNVKNQILKID